MVSTGATESPEKDARLLLFHLCCFQACRSRRIRHGARVGRCLRLVACASPPSVRAGEEAKGSSAAAGSISVSDRSEKRKRRVQGERANSLTPPPKSLCCGEDKGKGYFGRFTRKTDGSL